MRKHILSVTILAVVAIGLSACHSMPEHAKYIPKDATGVVSVDIASMGKKMAWNAIVGSKIFDEWKARPQQKDAMKGIENSGIDFMNTIYLYVKGDKRFGGEKATALVPLDDAAKWETFLKKNFPEAVVKDQGKRKEAMISENMYAGWDKKLLVIMNTAHNEVAEEYNAADLMDTVAKPAAPVTDMNVMSAEMEKAFAVAKDNSLVTNKHFTALQKEGHDIALWINYEDIMSDYMDKGAGSMSGLSISNTLWKDAAFTAGLDFNKGSIKSDMKYYMPQDLKEIGNAFGSAAVDKEMVEKLPTNNLDVIAAWHLSTKGLKSVMEKTGVLGLANVALSSQNLSVDGVLEAFTGDMGFVSNDFSVTTTRVPVESYNDEPAKMVDDYKYNVNYIYVLKINKKESFNKLLQLALSSGMLKSNGNNTYAMANGGPDAPVMVVNDKYAVVSNKVESATAYLAGGNKGPKLSGLAAESVTGHPLGCYFDVQQMVKSLDPQLKSAELDPAIIAEAKKLVENAAVSGGEFRNGAFEWKTTMNFTNKDENSLIQILNFAMHVNDAQNKGITAYNGKMH